MMMMQTMTSSTIDTNGADICNFLFLMNQENKNFNYIISQLVSCNSQEIFLFFVLGTGLILCANQSLILKYS